MNYSTLDFHSNGGGPYDKRSCHKSTSHSHFRRNTHGRRGTLPINKLRGISIGCFCGLIGGQRVLPLPAARPTNVTHRNKVRGKLCLQTRAQRLVSWRSLISTLGPCVARWRPFQYPNGFGTSEIYLVVSGAGIIDQGSGALEPPRESMDQCFIYEW